MVTGLNIFRDYFADDTDKYVLIGGAALQAMMQHLERLKIWIWC